MKSPLPRDIPPGAAVVVVALVLLASVVTGREDPPAAPAEPARAPASVPQASEPSYSADAADLDLEKLSRPRRQAKIDDLFAPRIPAPAPVAAPVFATPEPVAPPPPPAPSAPALPFRYLGMFIDEGKLVVFLLRNDEPHSVAQGQTIDGTYKIDEVTESAVTFTYLPLGSRQILPIPPQIRE